MTPVLSAAYTAVLITQGRAHPDLDMDHYRRGSVKTSCRSCMVIRLQQVGPQAYEVGAK